MSSDTRGFIIAIDGPVASGKGTVAPKLAHRLHGFYLHTGAMYRAIALFALQKSIKDTDTIIRSLPEIAVSFLEEKIFLNGSDVTERILRHDVSQNVAWIAAIPQVRKSLIPLQQKIGREKKEGGVIVVAEGRDVGTVVFPDAECKIFLDADVKIRAQRRFEQLQKRGETHISFEQILDDTKMRDMSDQNKSGALVKDPEKHGYVVVDSTTLTEEETLSIIYNILKQKGLLS